jgi:hypothetical protein
MLRNKIYLNNSEQYDHGQHQQRRRAPAAVAAANIQHGAEVQDSSISGSSSDAEVHSITSKQIWGTAAAAAGANLGVAAAAA